jgi:DNA polymerase III alpha subunit
LGITDVNPIEFNLRLERFLNPGRGDLPDLDLDFASQYRPALFGWIVKHFGREHVARVGSWQRFGVRSAFSKAALAHGVNQPQLRSLMEALGEALENLKEEKCEELAVAPPSFPLEPEHWPALLASARILPGRPQELTTHPSGFLLTAQPVEDYVPLQRASAGVALTQMDKDAVERLGLVKLDLLSSRALSTLAETQQHLRVLEPASLAPWGVDDSDPATLELLACGDTLGVSQLETPAMRLLLRQLKPRGLPEIVQALAITRPAAAKGEPGTPFCAAVGVRKTPLTLIRRSSQCCARTTASCSTTMTPWGSSRR